MKRLDKDPNAVALGRKGGRARVPKGFSMLSPKQRREIARKGALARQGGKLKCECGKCSTCYQREYRRRKRAKKGE
jgi:hypothetical protein